MSRAPQRLEAAFERARAERRAALIVFITCGDPDLDTTEALVPALAAAGADAVELGMPHSDPIGEGPTIQASSERALRRGVSLPRILERVARLRERHEQIPLLLMGYWNNALAYGEERLVEDCAAIGVDGIILADIPFDEGARFQASCDAKGVARVLLVTPTTTPERILAVAQRARGFVYCVSVTGVTGARSALPHDLRELVGRVRRLTTTPVAVGFGVSTPEQAAEVARMADGVIVGSALVERVARAGPGTAAVEAAAGFVAELRRAIEAARGR
jgi:tryptophan synthase alpha chain